MQTREALHLLVDELPDSEVPRASKVLQALLAAVGEGSLLYTIDTAPEDDELETPEERAGAEEALREIREGRAVPHDEVKRRWGLG
jgi:predicted transcriptional regulator